MFSVSERTISCWVTISMGLVRTKSSSELASALPAFFMGMVLDGRRPNLIFLPNCRWGETKGKHSETAKVRTVMTRFPGIDRKQQEAERGMPGCCLEAPPCQGTSKPPHSVSTCFLLKRHKLLKLQPPLAWKQ